MFWRGFSTFSKMARERPRKVWDRGIRAKNRHAMHANNRFMSDGKFAVAQNRWRYLKFRLAFWAILSIFLIKNSSALEKINMLCHKITHNLCSARPDTIWTACIYLQPSKSSDCLSFYSLEQSTPLLFNWQFETSEHLQTICVSVNLQVRWKGFYIKSLKKTGKK